MLQGFHRRGRDDDVFYVYTKSCSNVCTLWAPANQWRGNQAQVCRASGQHYKLSTCIAAHIPHRGATKCESQFTLQVPVRARRWLHHILRFLTSYTEHVRAPIRCCQQGEGSC